MTTAYTAYRAHMMSCPICGKGGPFCPEGLELGLQFERENRSLEVLTAECWEPPIENYPTDEQMDADYARWEASQKGKL